VATGYKFTRPDAEQLKFTSAKTGDHVLEDYLQEAELGNRTLSSLLTDLFDPNTGVKINQPTPAQVAQSFDNAAAALASAQAAAASESAAAASAASVAGGPVLSVNGLHGVVENVVMSPRAYFFSGF